MEINRVLGIAAAGYCQLGQRSNQEDSMHPSAPGSSDRLFIVCDGVGGTEGGELASDAVCRLLSERMQRQSPDGSEIEDKYLYRVIHDVQKSLDSADIGDAATTMTMLYLHDRGATIAHIGDSRVYQFRRGVGRIFRTHDHSLVQQFVDDGMLTEEQARHHHLSNVITMAMRSLSTSQEESVPDIDHTANLKVGDVFLLCTDGVWGELEDNELCEILCGEGSLDERMARLASATAGSHDNNTAIAVEVQEVDAVKPVLWTTRMWQRLWN